ncbi:MAG: hypothetical protein ACLFV4_09155 [Candidatus Hydrogenedentota bacterium]
MTQRGLLVQMLKRLLEDTWVIQQQGAGYYSCVPLARRYNKLLEQARNLTGNDTLVSTFEAFEEKDPRDPSDKSKVVQAVRIEIGQLISLLESVDENEPGSP